MKLYNSVTEKKEDFAPLNKKRVLIYVCGITPYNTTHLGHAFTYISFDVLIRYLRYLGYEVSYTQNVTDIDDDILKKAAEQNTSWKELGSFWTKKFQEDMKLLNILTPTNFVKATNSIEKIIKMVNTLLKKGFAYQRDGNVYFETRKFKDYGELSHLNSYLMLRFLKERGGDPFDPLKKNPLDFLLWQQSKQGEPLWHSPWGGGRPGWHIECSAMINEYLGDKIDIHGGGIDIKYPHHESEIAQSESYTGKKPFVSYWVHTGTVLYQGEKMAKSLGNLIMLSDLFKKYSLNAIRFALLSHHYRSPWEYKESEFVRAEESFCSIRKAIEKNSETKFDKNNPHFKEIISFLDDDLCVTKVLQKLTELSKLESGSLGNKKESSFGGTIKKTLEILGFAI